MVKPVKKGIRTFIALFLFSFSIIFVFASSAFALTYMERGISRYNRQDYEEAVPLLKKACAQKPKDGRAAYYLGMTYLRMWYVQKAEKYFRAALALAQSNSKLGRDAAYHLADALYLEGEYGDSLKAASAIKPGGMLAGKSHYIRGEALLKLGRSSEAISEFEEASKADPSLATSVEYETASAYYSEGKYGEAEKLFRGIITSNPYSNWALYSKDYVKALEKMPTRYRIEAGAGVQYDDNEFAVPLNGQFPIGRQKDGKMVYYLLGEYNFLNRGPWDLKGSYNLNIGQYFRSDYTGNNGKSVFSLDTLQHTVSLLPSYNTRKGTLGLLLQYNYLAVHWAGYSSSLAVNPSYTFIISGHNLGQVGFRYESYNQFEDFFAAMFGTPLVPAENMDSNNYALQAAYYYTFSGDRASGTGASGRSALFSARVVGEANNATGSNWSYTALKTSAGLLYPFAKRFRSNLLLEWYRQNFSHVNTLFGLKRGDTTYDFMASFSYALRDHLDLTAGFTHLRDHSNIVDYDYSRNIYTISLDYSFEGY